MLLYIVVAIVVLLAAFAIYIAMQPADFTLSRSTTINAPAAAVFAQVNDFHKWRAWSPWEGLDPELQRTYDGPPEGVGSVYSWVGNRKVGAGRMTITESRRHDLVRIKLEFLKPFKATNVAQFAIQPSGQQTNLTWSMTGKQNLIFKAFGLFMNMDKMVGPQFEKGLENMKSVIENAPPTSVSGFDSR